MATQVSSGNLPIPNDTGANVLADINENLEALQSNNAGSTVPPVAKKHQWYVDTSGSTDVLKIKGNADNAAFITLGNIETNLGMMPKTGGTFTGQITTATGNATNPSIKIDTNAGFYKYTTDHLGVAAAGVDVAVFSSDGLNIQNGKHLILREPAGGGGDGVHLSSPSLSVGRYIVLPAASGAVGESITVTAVNNLPNGATQAVLGYTTPQSVPTGTIMPWGGTESNIPSGFLECDGSQQSSTTYAALATVCGSLYNYGQTPDSGKFFLPDLRGRFIRGADRGSGRDPNRTIASEQESRNKRHTHSTSHSITGGDHSHSIKNIRRVGSNPSDLIDGVYGTHNITLGSGQTYHVGYSSTLATVNGVVQDSGNLTLGLSLTINNDPIATTEDESRPVNIALIYIIKH